MAKLPGLPLLLLGACFGVLFCSEKAQADYGERFLSVRCDPQGAIFEVEPKIIWNEELDALEPLLKQGKGKVLEGDSLLIQPSHIKVERYIESHCNISGIKIKVLLDCCRKLQIFAGDENIVEVHIEDVWDFSGYVFRVRYSPKGKWEELCGLAEERNNQWHVLDRKRADTNCRHQETP